MDSFAKPIQKLTRTATMVENQHGDRVIKIVFPYNVPDLEHVRTLSGRQYHAEQKLWSAPVCVESVESLKSWGFELDPRLEIFLQKVKLHVNDVGTIEIPGLLGLPFPYQSKGISFIENKNGRALVADEQGTGKTLEALGYLQLHLKLRPALIIVPASLKLNWEREAERWMPNPKVEILSGTKPWKITGEIIVMNYDIVSGWKDALKALNIQILILDECHMIKSSSAKRTKAVKQIAKGIPHVIGLSGTPIINRPIEIYNALKLINPEVVGSLWDYGKRFCGLHHNGYGWDFNGASHTSELHQLLTSTCMIRRLKSEVLIDLPEMMHSFVPIELDNEKEYQRAELDFIAFVQATKGATAAEKASNAATLAEIEGLKQLAVMGKMKQVIDWINNFLEADGKLVVFAIHKFVIDQLMETYKEIAVKIDGSVNMVDRQKAVDAFQTDDKIKLFIGNIQAAGVGITLSAASNLVFIELGWSPSLMDQAAARIHRISQKFSVMIYYLLAVNTIEEKIAKLLDKKRKTVDAVMDGIETDQKSLLSELMKEYI